MLAIWVPEISAVKFTAEFVKKQLLQLHLTNFAVNLQLILLAFKLPAYLAVFAPFFLTVYIKVSKLFQKDINDH